MARKTKAEIRQNANVASLAREHTSKAVKTLAAIMDSNAAPSARIAAATELLSRGWGRPLANAAIAIDIVDETKPLGPIETARQLAFEIRAAAEAEAETEH